MDGWRRVCYGAMRNDVLVQELVDLDGLGQLVEADLCRLGQSLFDDLVAEIDALVADVDARTGDQFLDLLPQKEHLRSSPPSPNLATLECLLVPALSDLVPATKVSSAHRGDWAGVVHLTTAGDPFVNDAACLGLDGVHHIVVVRVFLNLLHQRTRMAGKQILEGFLGSRDAISRSETCPWAPA